MPSRLQRALKRIDLCLAHDKPKEVFENILNSIKASQEQIGEQGTAEVWAKVVELATKQPK
jgi:hypothetical protein